MPSGSDEMRFLGEMKVTVERLASAIPVFENVIGRPIFIDDGVRARFRYKAPSERTIQLLMLVRIVSGLRATLILLSYGHLIEAGVLTRTVDDFIGDVLFVEEAIALGTPNVTQKKFIDNFFLETSDSSKQHVGRTQKVQASEGRVLSKDWHAVAEMAKTIDKTYDGYVHGDYSPTMDIYCGGDSEGFEVAGVSGAPPVSTYRQSISWYIYRGLKIFAILALKLGLADCGHGLSDAADAFEKTDAYIVGRI